MAATVTRPPTSDENVVGTWSGTVGSRFALVDDYPDTGGTDILTTSATGGGQITFGFSAFSLPSIASSISVIVDYYDRKNASQSCNIGARLKIGGSYFNAATHNPANGTITQRSDTFATNPATTNPWTPSEVNAIQAFGLNSTDSSPAVDVTSIQLRVVYTGDYPLSANPAAFVLAGADATFLGTHLLSLDPGDFALGGFDIAPIVDRILSLDLASFVLTGADATLTKAGGGGGGGNAQVLVGTSVVEDTSITTTWVDEATIPAASFTASKEYLILGIMSVKGTSNEGTGMRLVHGTTPTEFTDAHGMTEQTASDVRMTQFWMTRFTQPGTTEDVKLQFSNERGQLTNLTHMFSRIIAIKLSDDFVENTDFFWNEDTTDHVDSASFTSRASVTFTPNGTDKWLVVGQAVMKSTTNAVAQSLRINDSVGPANYGGDNRLSKDITDVMEEGYFIGVIPSNASHTFSVQTQSGTGTTILSSRIFALNLAKFAQSELDYTSGSTIPGTGFGAVASLSPTPNATGDWVVLANALGAPLVGDNLVARLQVNPDGSGLVSDPAYGDDAPDNVNSTNTNFGTFHLMMLRSLTSGASRPISFDWKDAAGSPPVKERAMVAFSVAMAGGGPQAFTLSADPASFTLSLAPTANLATRLLSLDPTSFALAGADAALAHGYTLQALAATFNLSGANAATQAARLLSLDPNAFNLAGANAATQATRLLSLDPATFSLAGQPITPLAARLLNASPAAFNLAGADASALAARMLNAASASFGVSGQASSVLAAHVIPALSGSFILAGADATLDYSGAGPHNYILSADAGVFTLTGFPIAPLTTRQLSLDPATFTMTGAAASALAARMINAAPATFQLTGANASTLAGRMLSANLAVFTVAGQPAGVLKAYLLAADPSTFVLVGVDAALIFGGVAALITSGRIVIDDSPLNSAAASDASASASTGDSRAYTATGDDE